MTDPRQHIAAYLAEHQGAHIREVTTAMRDRGYMCWNTAYKTIVKMADEGTITLTEGRRAVSFDGGIIAPNKPRNRVVKLCWLTIADDNARPLAERPEAWVGTTGRRSNVPSEALIQPGDMFGHWVVVSLEGQPRNCVLCRCECGALKPVEKSKLKMGLSRSCGCRARDPVEVEFNEMEGKTQTEEGHEGTDNKQTGPTIRRLSRSG